jgi:hypothetical protein
VEDTANSTHFIRQDFTVSSAIADFGFSCDVKANGRNFCRLALVELTGSEAVSQYFNLSTGAVGATGATGTNWADRRAFIRALGNGWYRCTLIARKTNAATSMRARLDVGSADGTGTFTGSGAAALLVWRGGAAATSVPWSPGQTTSIALPTGTVQRGNQLLVKGLPVSTSSLLKRNDEIEIISSLGSELKIVTASLDSGAAGGGTVQFSPAVRGDLSDNSPVIIHDPMFYGFMPGDTSWAHDPGIITSASAEFEEAA